MPASRASFSRPYRFARCMASGMPPRTAFASRPSAEMMALAARLREAGLKELPRDLMTVEEMAEALCRLKSKT